MKAPKTLIALLISASVALGSTATVALSVAPAAASSAPTCPVSALKSAKGTVKITFWQAMSRANETAIEALTSKFNASQKKVHVNIVQQGGYDVTWSKWQAGLRTNKLPTMAMIGDTNVQGIVDSRSIVPVQSCIKASKFNTKKFLPRVMSYWKIAGVQEGMPFNVSTPILYYNKKAFAKAGISKAPATFSDMIADAKKLKAAGQGGMGLKLDAWHLEAWLATSNQLFVNNGNGRDKRATASAFKGKLAEGIFSQLSGLVASGAAATNPAFGASSYDNLLGIGAGKFAMTIDTSAALGTITSLLNSGQYPNVELGAAAFPVYSTKTKGGVQPGGAALYISNRAKPAEQAAAWSFISWLDSAENQAFWSNSTGYIPVRFDAASQPSVKSAWAKAPEYKIAYNALTTGKTTNATSGAVVGPYDQVRAAIATAENSMYTSKVSAKKALENAAKAVDKIMGSYNKRVR